MNLWRSSNKGDESLTSFRTWEPTAAELKALWKAGKAYDRSGFIRAGRAFYKHAGRSCCWGDYSENRSTCNGRGLTILREIVFSQNTRWETRRLDDYGNVVEGFRPDGRGARWRASDHFFFGFLDPERVRNCRCQCGMLSTAKLRLAS